MGGTIVWYPRSTMFINQKLSCWTNAEYRSEIGPSGARRHIASASCSRVTVNPASKGLRKRGRRVTASYSQDANCLLAEVFDRTANPEELQQVVRRSANAISDPIFSTCCVLFRWQGLTAVAVCLFAGSGYCSVRAHRADFATSSPQSNETFAIQRSRARSRPSADGPDNVREARWRR